MAERILISDLEKSLNNFNELNYVVKNHLTRYLYAKKIIKPDSLVMDVACGSGYGSKLLASHGCKLISIDISEESINYSKKHNDHPSIQWMVGDIRELDKIINIELDAIVCFETLEHIEFGQEEVLDYFNKILKPNSPAICSIPIDHPDEKYHKRKFSYEQRDELFKKSFSKIEYSEENSSLIVGWKL